MRVRTTWRGAFWGLLGVALLVSAPARGRVPKPAEVLEKLAQWQASVDAFEARYSLTMILRADDPQEGRMTLQVSSPKYRMEREFGGKRFVFAFDGHQAVLQSETGTSEVWPATQPWAALFAVPDPRAMLEMMSVNVDHAHLNHDGPTVVWVLGGSPRDKKSPQLWVDRETGRPLRLISSHPSVGTIVMRLFRWDDKPAKNRVPGEVRVEIDGHLREHLALVKLEVPARFPKGRFQLSVPTP